MINRIAACLVFMFAMGASNYAAAAQDMVEKSNGQKFKGRITKETDTSVTIKISMGGGSIEMSVRKKDIHAVTRNGKRVVLNPLSKKPRTKPTVKKPVVKTPPAKVVTPPVEVTRTKAEVIALIDSVGPTPPDWWSKVALKYPPTLDLSWPKVGGKNWQNKKNPGHYVWDVINPNRTKWHEGIKFMHFMKSKNTNNSAGLLRCLNQLGTMYCSLEEDWVRAAYWWRKAGKGTQGGMGQGGFRTGYNLGLAKCYLRLGNRQMAMAQLSKERVWRWSAGPIAYMWAELGDYDKALQIAQSILKPNEPTPHMACGDIAMQAGRYDEALKFYKTAAGIKNPKYKGSGAGVKERIIALQAIQGLDLKKVRSGTFRASSNGYSADITVSVTVKSNRIQDVKIVSHKEKQYYSSLTDIPNQIIAKQSITGIDSTSGATITSMCIIRAAGKALRKGMR